MDIFLQLYFCLTVCLLTDFHYQKNIIIVNTVHALLAVFSKTDVSFLTRTSEEHEDQNENTFKKVF